MWSVVEWLNVIVWYNQESRIQKQPTTEPRDASQHISKYPAHALQSNLNSA